MSEQSTGAQSSQLTLFAEAFPVNRIQQLVDDWQPPTIATYGPSIADAFARSTNAGSDGSWLRTWSGFSQVTTDGSLEAFSGTWPRAGCVLNGTAYLRPPCAPLTREIESGLWPTPTINGNYNRKGASPTSGDGLATAVRRRWPTPTARDWKDGSYCPNVPINGLLGRAVWATPTAHPRTHPPRKVDHGEQLANQVGGALNPTWVEWLMGFPLGWTDCGDSGTRSSRKSPSGSSSASKTRKRVDASVERE
jgi:hypothetical protein